MTARSRVYKRRARAFSVGAIAVAIAAAVAACSTAPSSASGNSSNTITIAYEPSYVYFTIPQANHFFDHVIAELKAAHPGAKVILEPISGSYNDIVDKLSLLFRSPSTAPDVAEIPSAQIGLWASSGYFLALDKYLGATSWWSGFPATIKSEGAYDGKVYAVNQEENLEGLMYNIPMFRRAGLPVPWRPQSWQDILTAAEKIKATTSPSVIPLWLLAGNESGANGDLMGIDNLISGTSEPTIETRDGKEVVDSSGIRSAFAFYKEVYSKGLGAPISTMFAPTGGVLGEALETKNEIGICLCSDDLVTAWSKQLSAPYWPQAQTTLGVTPIPRETGGGVVSTIGGFDFAIGAHTKAPGLAFDFINLAESTANAAEDASLAGAVPPSKQSYTSPAYVNFYPPFNGDFASYLPYGVEAPDGANYTVWAEGMGNATGAIARNPNGTSVAAAVSMLSSFVTEQLGSSGVTTLP
jgi:multiple sugar transport system substrate-binding protein